MGRSLGLVVVGWAILGCASPGDSCWGGGHPDFDTCTSGPSWADCGGTSSEPRFACNDSTCRWFAHDCVAAGFEASGCSSDMLCCMSGGPYAPGDVAHAMALSSFTRAWGTGPWDASRERELDVTIGSPSTDPRPSAECSGTLLTSGAACGLATSELSVVSTVHGSAVTYSLQPRTGSFAGGEIVVELQAAGSHAARVCFAPFADVGGNACMSDPSRACASSGRVVISSIPSSPGEAAAAHLDLSATFPDGSMLGLRL